MARPAAEIFERIRQKYPQAIRDVVQPGVGDSFAILTKEHLLEACRFLKEDPELAFDLPTCVSGVDDGQTFWVLYHLYSTRKNHRVVLKVDAGKEDPTVPSVISVWCGADWHERETYDMYGIRFEGHSDLRRILLPEDWPGYPLRKDYKFPEEYQGIPLK